MKCRLCGNENTKILQTVLRRGQGTVYYCSNCDYGFLSPNFDNAKEYYNEEYRKKFVDKLDLEEELPEEIFEMRKDYQDDRLEIMKPYFDKSKSFMEIGSSAGQFISKIKEKFDKVEGIELSNSCADYVEEKFGIKIHRESLECVNWGRDDLFDFIAFFQVLEHIDNPITFMENVNNRLKEKGMVFIEVPNLYDALRVVWNVPEYEKFYYHEAHLSYFSETSIKRLLESTGFDVKEIIYLQDYNLFNHIYWSFNNSPQKDCVFGLNKPQFDFLNDEIGKKINILLNDANEKYYSILRDYKVTSNMMVVAEKK